jgi:toxin YoeB
VKLIFSEHAWDDYLYWQRTDRKILQRINTLIKESQRAPFEGIGKPEPLKHGMSGYWSRRITDEHRMVYKVDADALFIAQLRYHYCFFCTEPLWMSSGHGAQAEWPSASIQLFGAVLSGLSRHSRSLRERGHGGFPAHAWAECRAGTGLTRRA